jgi:hypothetical protein
VIARRSGEITRAAKIGRGEREREREREKEREREREREREEKPKGAYIRRSYITRSYTPGNMKLIAR